MAPLTSGVASPDEGAVTFEDAVVSLPNGAVGGGDRDSNVSPVSFHSLDSNDSSLLANPDITFEFHATIPDVSSSVVKPTVVNPSSVNASSSLFENDDDATAAKKTPATSHKSAQSSLPTGSGKKNKKSSTASTAAATDASVVSEVAVNAYTCHTPRVVLASSSAQNPDATTTKKIRRQTSTRVEEANVQFQVALPAVNGVDRVEDDEVVAKENSNSVVSNSSSSYAMAAKTAVQRDQEQARATKDPWVRVQRHADPALVSQQQQQQQQLSSGNNEGGTGKKAKTKKPSDLSSVHMKPRPAQINSCDDAVVEKEIEESEKQPEQRPTVSPANAQRHKADSQRREPPNESTTNRQASDLGLGLGFGFCRGGGEGWIVTQGAEGRRRRV